MRQIVKRSLLNMIPDRVKRLVMDDILKGQNITRDNIHFSQEGEDIILDKIYIDQKDGFYVDVGAHHPSKLSNTYKYYLRGWNGINIDAMPGSMEAFLKVRPKDINLELGVSETEGELPFYVFEQPTLNTFDEKTAKEHERTRGVTIKKVVKVKTFPLNRILDQYLKDGQQIDFLSIDVEGFDYQVLLTNNWEKYTPKVILVESIGASIEDILQSEIYKYLTSKGYLFISKTFHTNIFQHRNYVKSY